MAKKILIIEDDSFLQGLVATKLTKEGYEIMTAVNGEEAVKIADEKQPDFILLDLVLPGMDGFEVLTKIRKNDNSKKTPVIVFSNLAEDKDMVKAKELGANEFMVKSNFTLDELAVKIKEILS
jgi:two-component system alkaline phosphatase synthesis response regulator PhoP